MESTAEQRAAGDWTSSMVHLMTNNWLADYYLVFLANIAARVLVEVRPFLEVCFSCWRTSVRFLTWPYRTCCAGVLIFFGWPVVVVGFWAYVALCLWRHLSPRAYSVGIGSHHSVVKPKYVRRPPPELALLQQRQQQWEEKMQKQKQQELQKQDQEELQKEEQLQRQLQQQKLMRQQVLQHGQEQTVEDRQSEDILKVLEEVAGDVQKYSGPPQNAQYPNIMDSDSDSDEVVDPIIEGPPLSSSAEEDFDPTDYLPPEFLAKMTFIERRKPRQNDQS